LQPYRLEDARVGVLVLNSTAGTARVVVERLRGEGLPVGLLKLRMFRPFPVEELSQTLEGLDALAVLDRAEGFSGAGGPLFVDVCAALCGKKRIPQVVNYVYGLGGRDVVPQDIETVFRQLLALARGEISLPRLNYLGVRE
ncbi:MAG: hypothetical protein K6T75_07710, partial [Acetobacteraceae bacterium]|nr:hypothetical protein [Acetobacteraceae bacterium]